jgi:hypothetical protein
LCNARKQENSYNKDAVLCFHKVLDPIF